MISTGDTAFVLKQHTTRTASASGLRRRLAGLPSPCVSNHRLIVASLTHARATAYAPGLKGRR
jgi:hypothetical protein